MRPGGNAVADEDGAKQPRNCKLAEKTKSQTCAAQARGMHPGFKASPITSLDIAGRSCERITASKIYFDGWK
ncbi:hypothetical protein OFEAOIEE_LOCUS3263 [Methylorubrum extorquens]